MMQVLSDTAKAERQSDQNDFFELLQSLQFLCKCSLYFKIDSMHVLFWIKCAAVEIALQMSVCPPAKAQMDNSFQVMSSFYVFISCCH